MNNNHKEMSSPFNYLLLGPKESQKEKAGAIVLEEYGRCREAFDAKETCFKFELRYIPPFEKEFFEIRRLQGCAAEMAGRRDEFRGYIIIDLSGYLTHENEHYLEVVLWFLIDMNDCWKYIFIVDNKNNRASQELAEKVLLILLCDIPCKVMEEVPAVTLEKKVDTVCRKAGVGTSPKARIFFQELLQKQILNSETLTAFLRDVSLQGLRKVDSDRLVRYLSKKECTLQFMLGRKKYELLMDCFAYRKETWTGEKETL